MPFLAMSASVCGGTGTRCRVERIAGSWHAVSETATAAATKTDLPIGDPVSSARLLRTLRRLLLKRGSRRQTPYLPRPAAVSWQSRSFFHDGRGRGDAR